MITQIDTLTGFDRWGPRANPLIRQTLRRETRLSLRAALWIAFGIGLAGLAISTWQTLRATTDDLSNLDWILLLVGWPFVAFTPFAVSFAAALNTRRAIVPERFELVHLTPLPNESIVWALIFEALYGLRYALIAVVGIMPVLVIKTFHVLILFDLHMQNRFRPYYSGTYVPPAQANITTATLIALGLIVGAWGLTLLGAAVGIRSAILGRRTEIAIAAAPFAVLMTMTGQCMFVGVVSSIVPYASLPGAILYGIVLAVMVVLAPYLLVINAVWRASDRWGR
jgi:hypothetical protein